jgi:hypothetical protein
VILQIDVTVTGPGWVSTGSVAVDVTEPTAAETETADENTRMQQRIQALRWGASRA